MYRRSHVWVLGAFVAFAGACSSSASPPSSATSDSHSCKPRAPVEVRLETSPAAGGYDVTLIATPEVAVKGLELTLDGRVTQVGATAAGQRRTVTTRVTLGQLRSRDIVGSASVEVGTHRRRAAALATVGTPDSVAAPRVNIVRLPDGTEVAEVRP